MKAKKSDEKAEGKSKKNRRIKTEIKQLQLQFETITCDKFFAIKWKATIHLQLQLFISTVEAWRCGCHFMFVWLLAEMQLIDDNERLDCFNSQSPKRNACV